ncbi:hypothetical protein Pcinc_044244 [Petrolisthes cinctipes]|uniref:Secreted protein n=1 Tax=Petrolisthes cinctipes TaxID=88211 RepID=A0AAE1BEL2_PETCI|nr:hypothetical protein Pcinc_044244 [Petrolisthes cinctipes]
MHQFPFQVLCGLLSSTSILSSPFVHFLPHSHSSITTFHLTTPHLPHSPSSPHHPSPHHPSPPTLSTPHLTTPHHHSATCNKHTARTPHV